MNELKISLNMSKESSVREERTPNSADKILCDFVYNYEFPTNLVETLTDKYGLDIIDFEISRIGNVMALARNAFYGAGSVIYLNCIDSDEVACDYKIYANISQDKYTEIMKVVKYIDDSEFVVNAL